MDERELIDEAASVAHVTPAQAQQVIDTVEQARTGEALRVAVAALREMSEASNGTGFFAFPSPHRLFGR